ncbi:hypothetical protein [Paraflavitalea sp. CAU 1676]|uniref:hypothetical protein n=1 Tax=Paraflavitalea sp. CAU 1676 TaxID=3032598 RepID=UPI0023DCD0BA|nr:hypothetical protein [Paraflavitalea sp. CAU 1676]MDF2187016.1 hypothetical protein [Paraflavitalea sp. CAU 1676]
MKKIAAILLLSLLSFNWFGYRILADILQQQADIALEAKLDQNDYDESRLVEMRVTLDLPYQTNWTDFERVDGEIEIDGIHYKYVKRKVQDGQLVLMCLPNEEKMRLQTARDDFFKLVNDLQHPNQNKKSEKGSSFSLNSFSTEYWSQKNDWSIAALHNEPLHYRNTNAVFLSGCYTNTPGQPPEC